MADRGGAIISINTKLLMQQKQTAIVEIESLADF